MVTNGVVYEVEDGERLRPKGSDELELLKCGCTGSGCEESKRYLRGGYCCPYEAEHY